MRGSTLFYASRKQSAGKNDTQGISYKVSKPRSGLCVRMKIQSEVSAKLPVKYMKLLPDKIHHCVI